MHKLILPILGRSATEINEGLPILSRPIAEINGVLLHLSRCAFEINEGLQVNKTI